MRLSLHSAQKGVRPQLEVRLPAGSWQAEEEKETQMWRHTDALEAGRKARRHPKREGGGGRGGNTWHETQTWAHLEKLRRKEREAKRRRKWQEQRDGDRDRDGERGKEG